MCGMAAVRHLAGGVRLAVVAAGGVIAAESIAIARRAGLSFASSSTTAEVSELAAGGALIVAGVLASRGRARRQFGGLLVAAAVAWFIVDWNAPEAGSNLMFTAGLLLSALCPALLAHAALRHAALDLQAVETLLIVLGYACALLLSGLVPAMFFDPVHQGCFECPRNLVAVHSDPILVDRLGRLGLSAAVAWTSAVIVALAVRTATASPARRGIVASVSIPAAAYLTAVLVDDWHSVGRGFIGDDVTDHRLRLAESAMLVLLALCSGWPVLRRHRTRSQLARLVVDAAAAAPVGGLENAFGAALGDPSLRVLYPLAGGRLVDRQGRVSTPPDGMTVTRLVRDGTDVAVMAHRAGLLEADGVVEEITRTARLALENERLGAEAQARLIDLRASRLRVVASADAERRRLERDLHDGAQQKIVSFALGLQLARLQDDSADSQTLSRLDDARSEMVAALAELRDLAHGLYPRELADEGLAAGLETLGETSRASVVLRRLPQQRYPEPLESAVYFIVASCERSACVEQVSVEVTPGDRGLVLQVETDGAPPDVTRLADRVGALDGSLLVEQLTSGALVRVELPCGS